MYTQFCSAGKIRHIHVQTQNEVLLPMNATKPSFPILTVSALKKSRDFQSLFFFSKEAAVYLFSLPFCMHAV